MSNPVHENETYFIDISQSGKHYLLINRKTGVCEEKSKALPPLITLAEQYNAFLKNRLWRWFASQGDEQGAAMDKESAVVEFTSEMELDGNDGKD